MKRIVIAAMVCLSVIVLAQPAFAICECATEITSARDTLRAWLTNEINNAEQTIIPQVVNEINNAEATIIPQIVNEINNAEATIIPQIVNEINNAEQTIIPQVLARIDSSTQEILDAINAQCGSACPDPCAPSGCADALNIEIEEALRENKRIAKFYLPEANGGNLTLVRQIVADTIANVAASGESTNGAAAKLAGADGEIAAGRYKRAWSFLAQAYFEAIKIVGEAQ